MDLYGMDLYGLLYGMDFCIDLYGLLYGMDCCMELYGLLYGMDLYGLLYGMDLYGLLYGLLHAMSSQLCCVLIVFHHFALLTW